MIPMKDLSAMLTEKAALYIRVSTVYQVDKDSLKVQEKELINYAKYALGIENIEVFKDAGYSGKNTDRPDYQRMMRKIRTGNFSHLIVWKIDRISRNLLDFAEMYNELKNLGITFVSKNEQFDTSTAIGEAMLKIILIFAELERKMTSERVTAVMISRAGAGSWNGGRVPIGYNYDKITKLFSPHPVDADVVRLIFNSYERMRSSTAVAKMLNTKGIHTKSGKSWTPSTVCIVLNNPFYYGAFYYNRKKTSDAGQKKPIEEWIIVEDHHQGIIEKKQFDRCQEILKVNVIGSDRLTYNRKNIHIFAGLLFCDYCGENMAAQVGTILRRQGGVRSSRYSCYNRRLGLCKNRFTSDTIIGPFILNYIANMYRSYKTFGKTTSIETLEKKLLRGEAFKGVRLERHGLQSLFNALRTNKFDDTPIEYNPHIQPAPINTNGRELLLQDVLKEEKALQRLQTLFFYSENDFSPQEYYQKKSELDSKLKIAQKALDDYDAEQNQAVSSDEFMALASNFIISNSISSDRYLDFFKTLRAIDISELKLFFNSIISKCFVRDGKITSITFKNGEEHRFIYEEDE